MICKGIWHHFCPWLVYLTFPIKKKNAEGIQDKLPLLSTLSDFFQTEKTIHACIATYFPRKKILSIKEKPNNTRLSCDSHSCYYPFLKTRNVNLVSTFFYIHMNAHTENIHTNKRLF